MDHQDFWKTRSGRWRALLHAQADDQLCDRIAAAIREDVEAGNLPGGAIVPQARLVAQELHTHEADVLAAYKTLLLHGVFEIGESNNCLIIGMGEQSREVGEQTQVLFERDLIRAARRARDIGLSTSQATGVFEAFMKETPETDESSGR